MNVKRMTIICVAIASAILIVAGGCKKSEPETTTPTSAMEKADGKAAQTVVAAAASVEQTLCPVMGQPINKELFIEYKGKKVYFCCPGCEGQFKEAPEQYLAKLPQFKE